MNINDLLDERIRRIMAMVEINTKKIVKKELKKLKKEIVKGMVKK